MEAKSVELVRWIEANPEMLESLERIKQIADEDGSFANVEQELWEMSRKIGGVGLKQWMEQQEHKAVEQYHQPGTRKHSKKNSG